MPHKLARSIVPMTALGNGPGVQEPRWAFLCSGFGIGDCHERVRSERRKTREERTPNRKSPRNRRVVHVSSPGVALVFRYFSLDNDYTRCAGGRIAQSRKTCQVRPDAFSATSADEEASMMRLHRGRKGPEMSSIPFFHQHSWQALRSGEEMSKAT